MGIEGAGARVTRSDRVVCVTRVMCVARVMSWGAPGILVSGHGSPQGTNWWSGRGWERTGAISQQR